MKKILPILNAFILVLSLIICIIYARLYLLDGEYLMVLGSLVVIFLPGLIYMIEKIVKKRLLASIKTSYLIYIFISAVLGVVVNLYEHIIYYDKIMHFLSGVYITWYFILGYNYFLKKENLKLIVFIIFTVSFNAALALFWEFGEYTMDIILGTDFQKSIADTMEDALLATTGGLIVTLIYIFKHKFMKK